MFFYYTHTQMPLIRTAANM